MNHPDKWFFITLIAGLMLLLGPLLIGPAQPASAQCGTAASSCKNCHETQGKMPVANNGDWHKAHAFGDFCEFCHVGNVQATTPEEAHAGMVDPLADVQASCQGCHPNDYNQLAQTYASTLGVDLIAGGEAGGSANPPSDNESNDDISGCAAGTTTVSAPLGGEEIDYNQLYVEKTSVPPLVSNWGNVILLLLILGTGAAFFVTAWSWENWGQKVAGWIDYNVAPIPQAVAAAASRSDNGQALSQAFTAGNTEQVQELLAQKPELRDLLPRLMNLPPETLSALETILANPERGSDLLEAVSKVDTEVMAILRQLGARDQDLLSALLKE
jgi:hypothetical protein